MKGLTAAPERIRIYAESDHITDGGDSASSIRKAHSPQTLLHPVVGYPELRSQSVITVVSSPKVPLYLRLPPLSSWFRYISVCSGNRFVRVDETLGDVFLGPFVSVVL